MAIATGTTAAQDYQAKKERERRRQALNSLEGRDIFPIPDCQNPALREAVMRSFKRFAEVCFSSTLFARLVEGSLGSDRKDRKSYSRGRSFRFGYAAGEREDDACSRRGHLGCIVRISTLCRSDWCEQVESGEAAKWAEERP